MLLRAIAVFVGLIGSAASAEAFDIYCAGFRGILGNELKRPEAPSCLNMLGLSDDSFTFDMCRNDIERYRSQVRSYLSCLTEESNDVVDEVNKAVKKFNCYASGEKFCL